MSIEAMKQAQPDQEPFCYHDGRNIVGKEFADHSDVFPLYTFPPRQNDFNPDWDRVAALQESLREHMAEIQRLRGLLEQAEPVAWMYVNTDGECEQIEYIKDEPIPDDPSVTVLYTAPPQRKQYVAIIDTSPERVDET